MFQAWDGSQEVDGTPRLSQTPQIKVSVPQIPMNTPTLYVTEKKLPTPQSSKKPVKRTPQSTYDNAVAKHTGIISILD